MLVRLLRSSLLRCFFAEAPFKKIGRERVAELPAAILATKPKPIQDEPYPFKLAAEQFGYVRKDRLPNCRYFALEYQNRIYHFYNAFYYPLGRMINRVAGQIRGKNSPHYKNYRADVKNGSVCVIVNIEDPLVTGKRLLVKKLRYHTGFIGHLREYSYRHVLSHKPELLYHFLLRKVMPKNKLSVKYMENLILCRGPTHNLKNFPQFAPDRRIYDLSGEVNIQEIIKNDPSFQLISESQPGLAESTYGRKMTPYVSKEEKEQRRRELDENIEDLGQIHEDVPSYKTIPTMDRKKFQVLKRKERRIEERYEPVRAPYKYKRKGTEQGLKLYKSEKKARKDPNYELLKNQDLEETEQENVTTNPHVIGGAYEEGHPEDPKNKK